MRHILVAKVLTVSPGDNYYNVTRIDLGDILLNSNEIMREVAQKIGEKMDFHNCRYETRNDSFPIEDSFYLHYDVDTSYFMEDVKYETECVEIEVVSCLEIHGKRFKLTPFDD